MTRSTAKGSSPVAIHPTYPNLLRARLLDLGASRLSSRRGLFAFVLLNVDRLSLLRHVLGRTRLALRVDPLTPALWTSYGIGLLANRSPGARDRYR